MAVGVVEAVGDYFSRRRAIDSSSRGGPSVSNLNSDGVNPSAGGLIPEDCLDSPSDQQTGQTQHGLGHRKHYSSRCMQVARIHYANFYESETQLA
ncbi:hypothetical protein EYF80_040250 [Liparis tanakae]|uniref:Uncharacterized protein n=1 Tax=Liparis tanakae TaxID=230148 RepID=A0A4Z2GAF4_9TELE|nr:hypothetical protein EYF80_040250 [Liparis tanakae]